MMSLGRVIVAHALCVIAIGCNADNNDIETATDFLKRYGYLDTHEQAQSPDVTTQTLRHAIALFQEYYRLPGNGELNNITLDLMRTPRCGVHDISNQALGPLSKKWPKTHLTWNFRLASQDILETTRRAFDVWAAANSSLTFERSSKNPDILISFREGFHANVDRQRNGDMCAAMFDGTGGVLAHAFGPNGDHNYVSEIHVDKAEPWHLHVSHPRNKAYLFHTLTHEIGHSLGLQHNDRNDSIMYPFVSEKIYPVRLSLEDILNLRHIYSVKSSESPTVTPPTTTTTTTRSVTKDLCTLRHADTILIVENRMYIAHERDIWSVDINEDTYNEPLSLTNYMTFLPDNFTRLSAAYQMPNGRLVLFVNDTVYMVTYPGFELMTGWPRSLANLGIHATIGINAVVNTNRGKTFVIYDNHIAGELDDCSMKISQYHTISSIFPGVPTDITSAFRYIDGNVYFIGRNQVYKFNEFTRTIETVGKFDLRIVGVICPRYGLIQQLRDLLNQFVRINDAFTSADEERKIESTI